ncbi:hypothetical protein [Streptomyces phaeofaciens]|uniref:hypothetical protein n=1 Tax=Streptomyces phaeofaciens TaxID=68254 RepID=UPI0036AC93F7
MTDASPIQPPDEDGESAPPRRPVVRLGRPQADDHYGVVRADPPPDDHRHDETSPPFLLSAPAPQPAPPASPPAAEPPAAE